MVEDTVDELSDSPSLVNIQNDVYLTEHLADHISNTRHHLTGTPDHPEPPYEPSFHPPTGYWTPTEKALFFRALSVHSRLRPDLIAASIGTKTTADVAIYISLLRQGATRLSNDKSKSPSSHGTSITIGRDQHPAAHQVSAELVALEDQQAAHICAAEPTQAKEVESETRAEILRSVKNGLRVPRGEGRKGPVRDREGQLARKQEFERLRTERETEWAREDALARLDGVALQVLDRMLRVDEEKRAKAGSDGEEEEGKSSTMPHSSSPAGELHTTTPPPPATPMPNDNDDDAGTVPSNLSPASRRLISKRLYMRRKRAEASGRTAHLDPARLKPGRKVSATSKYKPPKPRRDDHGDGEYPNSNLNPERPERGYTRPYRIQHEFERLGIGAGYMRENGLGLFHLGVLGRLMRLYPRLDSSRPENVTESIAKETIETLHTLVVQFTRTLVRRAITLRELDFALRAHTKVWRLGERVVRPPHVRRALELCGGARFSSLRGHFGRLAERFSEGEESEDDGDDDDDDVPLMVRARMKMAKDIASDEEDEEDEDEDADTSVGEREQQPQQANDAAWQHWPSPHLAIYSPFINAPDLVKRAHPFGIYAPGTMPEQDYTTHVTYEDDTDESENEDEDLMPTETDEEALEAELKAEDRLDAADARAAAAYEARIWRELSAHNAGSGSRGSRKRRLSEDKGAQLRTRKRRRNVSPDGAGYGYEHEAEADLEVFKSAAVIEDSDSDC